jgi:hypothetical protein
MWSRLIFSGLPEFVTEVAVEQLPPRYTRIPREVKESLVFVSPQKNWRMTVEALLPAVRSDLCNGMHISFLNESGRIAQISIVTLCVFVHYKKKKDTSWCSPFPV